MKYIRTKDEIYNRSKIICCAFAREYQSEDWNKDIEAYLQTPILKQADTIEELCDEFVLIRQEKELGETIRVFTRLELLLEFAICQWETDIIYGAIWTDKGLIYLAKMNEKEELELL